jgi:hypothetical protein
MPHDINCDLDENCSCDRKVWMVVKDGWDDRPATFGPFASRAEAQAFKARHGGYLYDAIANQRSNCGPWY